MTDVRILKIAFYINIYKYFYNVFTYIQNIITCNVMCKGLE